MRPGICFRFPSGSSLDPHGHLWIVLAGPVQHVGENKVLTVSVTSCTGHRDDLSCVLTVGDHPFIRHDSFVAFVRTRLANADRLAAALRAGSLIAQPDATPVLVARIQRAALGSPHLANDHKAILRSLGVLPP